MSVFTFVLDSSSGRPVHDMQVGLEMDDNGLWKPLAAARTDAQGRITDWQQQDCGPARYRLWFDSAGYFGALGISTIFPEIMISVVITDAAQPTNVVLLMSPFSYSAYREAVQHDVHGSRRLQRAAGR